MESKKLLVKPRVAGVLLEPAGGSA